MIASRMMKMTEPIEVKDFLEVSLPSGNTKTYCITSVGCGCCADFQDLTPAEFADYAADVIEYITNLREEAIDLIEKE